MRTYVTQAEIAPLWVEGAQPHAHASAMSFEGDKFFSYDTVIAQRVKSAAGRTVYLLNSSGYSSTSSMHQNLIKAALPKSARVVYVPGCDRWSSGTFFDHNRILDALFSAISNREQDAKLAREPKTSRLKREARQIEKRVNAYMKLFSLRFRAKKKHLAVDHIDGNPANNKLSNVRVVTPKENL